MNPTSVVLGLWSEDQGVKPYISGVRLVVRRLIVEVGIRV